MRGHSLPGRERPLTSNSLQHLQSLRVHPIPQDGRVSGGRYLKVVGRTSAALTNTRESSSIRVPIRVRYSERAAERTHLRERFHVAVVEDGDLRLCDARLAQQ